MHGNLGFHPNIINIIDPSDRACMMNLPRGAFDLHDWESVSVRASRITKHLRGLDGLPLMPPQGWPEQKIQSFESWTSEGAPAMSGAAYSSFFRDIDAQTEYFDVYGAPNGLEDMGAYYSLFWGRDLLLQAEWLQFFQNRASTPILAQQKAKKWIAAITAASQPAISNGILQIDSFICDAARRHFDHNGSFDRLACLDAFRRFGEDVLPEDEDRESRVRALDDPTDYRLVNNFARFHRMDTRMLWFYWFGHLQLAMAIRTPNDPNEDIRKALVAGIFIGQVSDAAYREGSNRQTRPEYLADEQAVWQTAVALCDDYDVAATEIQDLYYIWTQSPSPMPIA